MCLIPETPRYLISKGERLRKWRNKRRNNDELHFREREGGAEGAAVAARRRVRREQRVQRDRARSGVVPQGEGGGGRVAAAREPAAARHQRWADAVPAAERHQRSHLLHRVHLPDGRQLGGRQSGRHHRRRGQLRLDLCRHPAHRPARPQDLAVRVGRHDGRHAVWPRHLLPRKVSTPH